MMSWENAAFRLLVVGVLFSLFAGTQWIWSITQNSDPMGAQGALTGGVLVSIAALVWMYRDRRDNDSDQTV